MKKFVNLLTVAICALLLISASTSNNTAFAESKTVRLGGQPFGVRFYNDGLIVVELEEFYDGEKYVCPAKDGGLKENDIIKEVNKTPVNTNEELQNATVNSSGEPIDFLIERNGESKSLTVTPSKNAMGMYATVRS